MEERSLALACLSSSTDLGQAAHAALKGYQPSSLAATVARESFPNIFGDPGLNVLLNATALRGVSPTAEQLDLSYRVSGVFDELGAIGDEAVRLIHGLFLTSDPIASASDPRLPGLIVLGPRTISDDSWLAESLFHECIHQKLYATWIALPLIDPRKSDHARYSILPSWVGPHKEHWSPDRALAAFHVYVHLCLFVSVTRSRDESARTWFLELMVRVRVLAEWVKEFVAPLLTPLGCDFIQWLDSALPRLRAVNRESSERLARSSRLLQRATGCAQLPDGGEPPDSVLLDELTALVRFVE